MFKDGSQGTLKWDLSLFLKLQRQIGRRDEAGKVTATVLLPHAGCCVTSQLTKLFDPHIRAQATPRSPWIGSSPCQIVGTMRWEGNFSSIYHCGVLDTFFKHECHQTTVPWTS
jgi:hypothetical protein